jgi:transcription antitermination factor NusG
MTNSELLTMSLEDLRMLNTRVVEMIKMKRKQTSMEKKFELEVGMMVKVNHPKLLGMKLVVDKINRTNASLKVLNGFGGYNVPINMIEII